MFRYKLLFDGEYKVYKLNNIEVIYGKTHLFRKKEMKYEILDNIIIQNVTYTNIVPFIFYNSDYEATYKLYKCYKNSVLIELRVYTKYKTITYKCNHITDFLNNKTDLLI